MNDELTKMNLEQFKKFIACKLKEIPEWLLEILADNMVKKDNDLFFMISINKLMETDG